MMELIKEWRKIHVDLRARADKLDQERDRNPKYYTAMTEEERRVFDDLRQQAYVLRCEAAVWKKCYDRLVAEFTTNA